MSGGLVDFTANVPAITDKGIYVGPSDGTSGADVMPVLPCAALAGSATVYVEWHNAASPGTGKILSSLNSNQPGASTKGGITPNGSANDDSASFQSINRLAIAYDTSVWSRVINGASGGLYEDYNGAGAPVASKTGVGIGRYYTTTASGWPDAYIRRISVFDSKIPSQGLRVLTYQPDMVLAGVGDSIVKGDGVNEFLQLVADQLPGRVFAPNYGVNGNSWVYDWGSDPHVGTMTDDVPYVAGLLAVPAARSHRMVAFAGTNGIVIKGNSAAQEYADFETWFVAATGAGWLADDIVVPTMLPRTGVSEVVRGAYNALLVAGSATHGYRLARFDLDPTMGAAGANLNTTYYSDGTHPTKAGHVILAGIVRAVL